MSEDSGVRTDPNKREPSRNPRYIGRLSWAEFNFLECVDRAGVVACAVHELTRSLGVNEDSAGRMGWHLKRHGLVSATVSEYTTDHSSYRNKNTPVKSKHQYSLSDLGKLFLDEAYECLDARLECAV